MKDGKQPAVCIIANRYRGTIDLIEKVDSNRADISDDLVHRPAQ